MKTDTTANIPKNGKRNKIKNVLFKHVISKGKKMIKKCKSHLLHADMYPHPSHLCNKR